MNRGGYNSKRGRRNGMNTRAAKRRLFGNRASRPCHYCGKRLTLDTATFDHVRALSRGGYDKTSNGALACGKCNSQKGSMSAGEFFDLLRAREARRRA
jgi:5-methylcytosine-specific restriction endonuclease McrA